MHTVGPGSTNPKVLIANEQPPQSIELVVVMVEA